jgi:hypothetical protein
MRKFSGLITKLTEENDTLRVDGVFIPVNNYITCTKICVDGIYEMVTIEVKGRYPKCTWEFVGIYRLLNVDTRLLEKLTDRLGYMGRTTKRSIIGGDLNLTCADYNGHEEKR